jgi:hypothetical protein
MPAPKVVNPFSDNDVISEADAEAQELGGEQTAEPVVAEPAQQAQPETQQPAADAEPPNKNGAVPYPRFAEVNEEKNKYKAEASEMREKWARLEERQRLLQESRQAAEAQRQAANQAAQRPDPASDPIGAELYDTKQTLAQQAQALQVMQQEFQQRTQGLQQNQDEAQFNNYVQNQVQAYSAQDPNYIAKATHAANWRIGFWQEMGLPPEVAKDIVQKESVLVAKIAQQYGVNFAPIIAGLGERLGWQAPQQAQQPQNGQLQPAPQTQQNAALLNQVRKGQRVQGMGNIPGSGAEGATSYRNYTKMDLERMTDAQFNAVKARPKDWADLQYAMAVEDGLESPESVRY